MYITNDIIYEMQNDLKILKSRMSESIFIETINLNKKPLLKAAYINILSWKSMNLMILSLT